MTDIPEWYDPEMKAYRNDIWPFQVKSKGEARYSGKERLGLRLKRVMEKLPKGWTVRWLSRRNRSLAVNHTKKEITLPFPKTFSGLALLNTGIYVAKQIDDARTTAAYRRSISAAYVTMWGHYSHIDHSNNGWSHYASLYAASWMPYTGKGYTHDSWKQAHLMGCKAVLRYQESPSAWSVPRYKAGDPRLAFPPSLDSTVLKVAAYRKFLLDYVKVNDADYPLPIKATALMQKITPPVKP